MVEKEFTESDDLLFFFKRGLTAPAWYLDRENRLIYGEGSTGFAMVNCCSCISYRSPFNSGNYLQANHSRGAGTPASGT